MPLNKSSQSRTRIACLACLLPMLTGCVTSGAPGVNRDLPETPDWVKPVPVPDPAPNTPWILAAARYKASLLSANRVIVNTRAWNEGVRKDYAK